jgi:hypothetical protein
MRHREPKPRSRFTFSIRVSPQRGHLGCSEQRGTPRARKVRPDPHCRHYVIIRTEKVYALYAHPASGSVVVGTGKVVHVGEVIARLGHSGNSTAPHLHLQLMDAADPLHANGIPCAFAEYLVQGNAGWEGSSVASRAGSSASARLSSVGYCRAGNLPRRRGQLVQW